MLEKHSADDILKYFFYLFIYLFFFFFFFFFFSENVKTYCLGKYEQKKTIISLSFLEFAQRVVKVNQAVQNFRGPVGQGVKLNVLSYFIPGANRATNQSSEC